MADEKLNTPAAAADPAYDMAKKRQMHPQADERNRIEIIRGREVLTCGARKKKGPGFCRQYAGMGTQHPGYGRCKFCGGSSTGPRTPEGQAVAAQNARKHGFYSPGLSGQELEAYNELRQEAKAADLEHEIYMWKAKIKVYMVGWRARWDRYYKIKRAEKYVKYRCTNPDCRHVFIRGELEGKPGYCPGRLCGEKRLEEVERWVANRTHEEAEAYADSMTRVWYSEGEGARSYYHAGSIEDRALVRALAELRQLVKTYAQLDQGSGDDLLGQINAELRAASRGKVSISWGGAAQQRLPEKPENGGEKAGK